VDGPAEHRPVIHVVSYLASSPFDARGIRTRRIIDALSLRWQVDLLAGPVPAPKAAHSLLRRGWDYGLYRLHRALAMDSYETWSIRRLSRWRPHGDGALLIGYPFSPLAYAAYALRRAGIPYVVDVGDPWTLTARVLGTEPHSAWRGRRAERALWDAAAGAILTTEPQAAALAKLFPTLPTLVRPNGYQEAVAVSLPKRLPPPDDELHLGHFGRLYGPRIDIDGALSALVASGRWRRIVLHQFGDVARGTLDSVPTEVRVITQPARPWGEVQTAASRLSAVLVVGNRSRAQLPSKVVDYLTLPSPRIALVRDVETDAIAEYLKDKTGWLVAAANAHDLPDQIAAHLGRKWTSEELAPPAGEAWPQVAAQISRFVGERFENDRLAGTTSR
jgi:hypothetical protein